VSTKIEATELDFAEPIPIKNLFKTAIKFYSTQNKLGKMEEKRRTLLSLRM